MKNRLGVCMLLWVLSCPVLAQDSAHVYDGYLNGESYLELSETSRMVYAIGVVDGLLSSGLYGADPNEVRKLHQCTVGMSGKQLREVLDQHVRAHQANWQDPMNVLATNALVVHCPAMRPGA